MHKKALLLSCIHSDREWPSPLPGFSWAWEGPWLRDATLQSQISVSTGDQLQVTWELVKDAWINETIKRDETPATMAWCSLWTTEKSCLFVYTQIITSFCTTPHCFIFTSLWKNVIKSILKMLFYFRENIFSKQVLIQWPGWSQKLHGGTTCSYMVTSGFLYSKSIFTKHKLILLKYQEYRSKDQRNL